MTNKEIAKKFSLLGKIMELHGESSFKTRSYNNAYLNLRKLPTELSEMTADEISALPGIGKAISSKISELLGTGEMQTLNKYLDITPTGIVQMMSVKGFGPKKIAVIWKELEIETVGELMYAINENRLVDLKGFGEKTQASLKDQLEYFLESSDKIHFATAEKNANELIDKLKTYNPNFEYALVGQVARKCNIIDQIEVLTTAPKDLIQTFVKEDVDLESGNDPLVYNKIAIAFHYSDDQNFISEKLRLSSGAKFWKSLKIKKGNYKSESELFEKNNLPYLIPEFREDQNTELIEGYNENVVTLENIKGCIHNHSTYSDGVNTIEEMLQASYALNHEYFVLTDHSKSAFYANGLQEERLLQQLDEIREIDQSNDDIKLFSGIESDILSNGDLDYPDDILAELDVVIASVHSNLKMDKDKATQRLIKAIENPYTNILGHATGRLLLSRKGYPLDMEKIIDACANNFVAIELNANPLRLDIDWTWIHYALEKDVLISINPDAHSTAGIKDIYYGVCSARKAGLPVYNCLNAYDLEEFQEWLQEQHEKR